jgi:hypothetical protein
MTLKHHEGANPILSDTCKFCMLASRLFARPIEFYNSIDIS